MTATEWMRRVLAKAQALFKQGRANREFDEELEEHVRLLTERFERRGMGREEAARAARLQFGNTALVEQRHREARTFLAPAELWRDVCFGVRMLRKYPVSTAAVVVALALGIGMNTCVFSFVNAMLLRPPAAVESPGQLREIWGFSRKANGLERYLPLTYPDYTYLRDHAKSFAGILAYDPDTETILWNRSGSGEVVRGEYVSGNFFSIAGVSAAMGRVLSAVDDQSANPAPVAVLGNAFWKRRMGSDPNVVGKTMTLNGVSYSVIGVAPEGFTGFIVGITPDFWSPLSMIEQTVRDPGRLTNRNAYWLLADGRLAPGASSGSAQAELSVLAREIDVAHPETNKDWDATLFSLAPVPGPVRGYVEAFTGLLMAVFTLVLVIACTNAAGLLLVKAKGRSREMAIRSALGAGRGRLMRQMVVESAMLSLIAGCAALAVAWWTSRMLLNLSSQLTGLGASAARLAGADLHVPHGDDYGNCLRGDPGAAGNAGRAGPGPEGGGILRWLSKIAAAECADDGAGGGVRAAAVRRRTLRAQPAERQLHRSGIRHAQRRHRHARPWESWIRGGQSDGLLPWTNRARECIAGRDRRWLCKSSPARGGGGTDKRNSRRRCGHERD
jgi:hypothetical protein